MIKFRIAGQNQLGWLLGYQVDGSRCSFGRTELMDPAAKKKNVQTFSNRSDCPLIIKKDKKPIMLKHKVSGATIVFFYAATNALSE